MKMTNKGEYTEIIINDTDTESVQYQSGREMFIRFYPKRIEYLQKAKVKTKKSENNLVQVKFVVPKEKIHAIDRMYMPETNTHDVIIRYHDESISAPFKVLHDAKEFQAFIISQLNL